MDNITDFNGRIRIIKTTFLSEEEVMEKHFELWLDESGDFEKDNTWIDNPSIVAGVLIEKGKLNQLDAMELCGGEPIHSTNFQKGKFGSVAVSILGEVIKRGGKLVVFENKERLRIVNGDTTYLNVISEGLIQLLQSLSLKDGKVKIDILIANRVEVNAPQYGKIIEHQEYQGRLEEKIILGIARRNIYNTNNWEWSIERGSARKDFRLMLADVVSHAWYRKKEKCSLEEQEILNHYFSDGYYFTVIESSSIVAVRNMILDGDLGSAIFQAYSTQDPDTSPKIRKMVFEEFQNTKDFMREIHLHSLFGKIKILLNHHGEIAKCRMLLENLQMDFLNRVKDNNNRFLMEVYLYLYTVSTREEDFRSAEIFYQKCEDLLGLLPQNWQGINYYFILKIRRAVHLCCIFDYYGCLRLTEEIIKTAEDLGGVFPLAHGLSGLFSQISIEELGKALGTGLQARIQLLHTDPAQVEFARRDSDRALQVFSNGTSVESNLKRQKQYRCWLEYQALNEEEAIKWLLDSYSLDMTSNDFTTLIRQILWDNSKVDQAYSLKHYIYIMSNCQNKNDVIFQKMFDVWNANFKQIRTVLNNHSNQAPFEKIYWRMGRIMSNKNSLSSAIEYYDQAFQICNAEKHRVGLRIEGLKILTEKALVLSNAGKRYSKSAQRDIKKLVQEFKHIKGLELPESVLIYLKEFELAINALEFSRGEEEKRRILSKLFKHYCLF